MNFQEMIESYRKDFFRRSNGFNLPYIDYLGSTLVPEPNLNRDTNTLFIAIPVKNQQDIIVEVIRSLIKNTTKPATIGFLFDNCTDSTQDLCQNFFQENIKELQNIKKIHFIKSSGDLFESTCENILFLFCEEKYFVSMQADIYLNDSSWFERCIKALSANSSLFALTGRAVVPFRPINKIRRYTSKVINLLTSNIYVVNKRKIRLGMYIKNLGYFGNNCNYPKTTMYFSKKEFNTVYLGDSIIRGPIMWKSQIFKSLGSFNDLSYWLGRDDTDLCLRARYSGYLVGYLPSKAYSISDQGSSRKKRSQDVLAQMELRAILAKNQKGSLDAYWTDMKKYKSYKRLHKSKIKI